MASGGPRGWLTPAAVKPHLKSLTDCLFPGGTCHDATAIQLRQGVRIWPEAGHYRGCWRSNVGMS